MVRLTGYCLLAAGLLLSGCTEKPVPAPAETAAPVAAAQNESEQAGIHWFAGSIEQAFAAAKAGNKPVFLYWGAEWCPPCHQLKATIFQRDEFIQQSRLFVPVYLDGDTERAQKYGERFAVYGYPTVIIFNPEGAEITRIPGGMDIEQYVGVLELALNALRPVSELLRSVQDGEEISDSDWKLLIYYSWGQDRGRALGEQELHQVMQMLARACPPRLAVERSSLQMQALDAWAKMEQPDPALARTYLQQVQGILANKSLARQNLYAFGFLGATMVTELAPAKQQRQLQQQIQALLREAIEDGDINVLQRLDAIYGWADVSGALLAEDEKLDLQAQVWVKQQVVQAQGELNSYQLHTGLNTVWQLYYNIGLEAEARAALREGIAKSKQPYYFMSGMGYVEREAGNTTEALLWYRKARDAAQGPATRVQWGSNYILAMLSLSPDDLPAIRSAAEEVFLQLASQPEGLHHRSSARMDKLGRKLLEWVTPQEGADTTTEQREAVLQELRVAMDQLCAGVEGEGDAAQTCSTFLVPIDASTGEPGKS